MNIECGLVGADKGPQVWNAPGGGRIALMAFETLEELSDHLQGTECDEYTIEEATLLPYFGDDLIDILMATMRAPNGIPKNIFLTSNPNGVSRDEVKRRYVRPMQPGTVYTDEQNFTRMFVPSYVSDNKVLMDNSPQYLAMLRNLRNPTRRKQWLEGDWEAGGDGFFSDSFTYEKNTVPPFIPPKHWPVWPAYDHGYSKPFCCLWFTVADGFSSVNGNIFPRGTVIVFLELYGVKSDDPGSFMPNKGVKKSMSAIARAINRQNELWGVKFTEDGYADPACWGTQARDDGDTFSVASVMEDHGIYFIRGFNRRTPGWQIINQLFEETGTYDPGLVITRNCIHLLRTLEKAEPWDKNTDDIDTDYEDHALDALRYGLTPSIRDRISDVSDEEDELSHVVTGMQAPGYLQRQRD